MGIDVPLSTGLILALALIVDGLSGEPDWLYRRIAHPVVLMSKFLMFGERWLNKPDWSGPARRRAGISLVVACVVLMLALGVVIQSFLTGPIWGDLVLILLTSTLLAGRSLHDHVLRVAEALGGKNGLDNARQTVGMIIGRDTSELDEAAISRASLESLAENFSDGVVAPAFWFLVGGLPGILIYKMINTADSMIGHKSERYKAFGWAAARLDDILNLIPARLTVILFALAALVYGRAADTISTAWRDAKHHVSPNAGWPEAAMAGALNLQLGGPRRYPGGVVVNGAWFGRNNEHNNDNAGNAGNEATKAHIHRGIKLAIISWRIMLIIIVIQGVN